MPIVRWHAVPSETTQLDPLPNTCNGVFQALPTVVLDGSDCYRMGNLFHLVGEYWFLPRTMLCDWYCRVYRRLHSISED